jgi:8-oxo-dGTP pyrophosphatase MutT (NUDIX family)
MVLTLARIEEALSREPVRVQVPAGARQAAVAAILTPALELVLLRRAEHPGDPWSGHVSFPGGRVEAGETPLEAAIRETAEEIGVPLDRARLLGPLDELRTAGDLPPLRIHPFVFALPFQPEFRPNYEVASVHSLALGALLAGAGRATMRHPWRGGDLDFPCVDFAGGRLWGLTLHVVDDLLHRLDGRGRGLARNAAAKGATPWEAV